MKTVQLVVLYTRLTGYWMACLRELVKQSDAKIHIFRKERDPDAPFQMNVEEGMTLYDEEKYSVDDLIQQLTDVRPDLIYVAGWANRKYLKVIAGYSKSIPVVMGLDNHWKGTLKQIVGAALFRFSLRKKITHLFIPGLYQYPFALRLGFSGREIMTGLYSADINAYHIEYKKNKEERLRSFPKTFVFVGRLVHHKGIDVLLKAFANSSNRSLTPWQLVILGNGKYHKQIGEYKNVDHIEFVQPEMVHHLLTKQGVFVLPSRYEAWGVVVHEAAAAGLPIISTFSTGAATCFVKDGYNGFLTDGGSVESLEIALTTMMNKTDHELATMGERSFELSKQISPEIWTSKMQTLLKVDRKKNE